MLKKWKAGGAVAEWSKALKLKENMNENENIPGSPPPGQPFKKVESYKVPNGE